MEHTQLQFPIRLGYDTISVLSQYWEGQGDPLYAILSRRGNCVDWVEVRASDLEIIRLRDTCTAILANPESEDSHIRVATAYLERANRCYTKVLGRAQLHRSALFRDDLDRLRNGDITDEEFGYIKLLARGAGGRQCGMNADWSVSAWHIGPSATPNRNDGDLYLTDDEDGYMSLVQRTYGAETDGNDLIDQICRWSTDELV